MSRKRGFWGGQEEEPQTTQEQPSFIEPVQPKLEEKPEPPKRSSWWFPASFYVDKDQIPLYEELTKESKTITGLSELFDGFKFYFNKGVSPHLAVNHTIGLGSAMEPATYNFGTHFMKNNWIMWGQIDTDGHMYAKYQQVFDDGRSTFKATSQVSNEPHSSGVSVEVDHKGPNWSLHGRWMNPGTYGLGFLQYITRNLCIGTDIHYMHKQAITVPTMGARYTGDGWIGTGILAPHVYNFTYTRMFGNRVGLSTDLSFALSQNGWEPQWSLGYEYRLTMSMFRGHIDSGGRVAGLLEESLNQFTKFALCGDLDYAKNQYRFGLAVHMQL